MPDQFSPGGPGKRKFGGQTVDRRTSERKVFSAVAEVMERASRTKLSVRIGDLSLHGCYGDSLSVFPAGTLVQVSIQHAGLHFLANGKVAYSKAGMGMGMSFEDLPPETASVLQSWIGGVVGAPAAEMEMESPRQAGEPAAQSERNALGRLIDLMMRKGLLTSNEGADLLGDMQRISRK